MNYPYNVERASGINLRDVGWNFPIDTSLLLNPTKDDKGIIFDECFYLGGKDMTDEFFEAVQWAEGFYDESEAEKFMLSLVKEAECYLVFHEDCFIEDGEEPPFVSTVLDTIDRTYDCAIFPVGASKGGKTLVCREFNYDFPAGKTVVIIALTDRESDFLEKANFREMKEFVNEQVVKI